MIIAKDVITLIQLAINISDTKAWLLDIPISGYRLAPALAPDIRGWLADVPHRELARHFSGGLTYGGINACILNMIMDTHQVGDVLAIGRG